MSQAHIHFSPIIITIIFLPIFILPLMDSSINNLDYGNPNNLKQEVNMMPIVIMADHVHLNHNHERDQKTAGGVGDGGGRVSCCGKMGMVGPAAGMKSCQAEKCGANLMEAKQYHRRHKVCEYHAKAQFALVAGFRQRFCQQCSRFHELAEFDDTKRSCRRRLAGHNERRRKTSGDSLTVGGSSRKGPSTHLKEIVCGQQVDDTSTSSGRIQIPVKDKVSYKHFQIR